MISELFPIISTRDFERSLSFYRDLLGGTVSFEYPDPGGRIVYAGLDFGTTHLGIGSSDEIKGRPLPGAIAIWMYTDECDALVGRLREAGFQILAEPADQPWGERVARVADPDGNEVILGQRGTSSDDVG